MDYCVYFPPERDRILFANPIVNDLHLDSYSFRLFCHIARRGDCFAKQETIANICNMSRSKVQKSAKVLESRKLIKTEPRHRQDGKRTSNKYLINNNIEEWVFDRKDGVLQKNQKIIFVHPLIDLYGLDVYQFRLLMYLVSCNWESNHSQKEIKRICGIEETKIRRSLTELKEYDIIEIQLYKGKPSCYKIKDLCSWDNPKDEDNECGRERQTIITSQQKKLRKKLSCIYEELKDLKDILGYFRISENVKSDLEKLENIHESLYKNLNFCFDKPKIEP